MYKHLQKLGKALMLPVAVLPICGILMGIGYLLCPAFMMGNEWATNLGYATSGPAYSVGFFLITAGNAIIDNMAILFAIGVGVGLSQDSDGTGGVAALVSWLMMTSLVSAAGSYAPGLVENKTWEVAYSRIANPFIGILAGVIGSWCYNKFKSTQLPNWLSFFSGKRCVAIVTGVVSIVVSAVLLFAWPVIFSVLVTIGSFIAKLDVVGVGLYTFLNRLLIPTGLHHAVNNVFWFDTIGLGDLSAYWSGQSGTITKELMGTEISWSVGQYMSGFFPCMMFGVAGAAVAMVRAAKNKKVAIGIVSSAAICAFVCGVTEPFEFAFMFLAFPLYVAYALLYAIFAMITVALGFRAGFCFSAGATDLLFSATLPAHAKTWLILPLGIAAFVVFYLVFYFAIKKFNLKTPGNEDEDAEAEETKITLANNDFTAIASGVLAAVGGKGNVSSVDYCTTRLRFEIKDYTAINEKAVKAAGAAGVIRPSKNACQVIIGPKVQFVYDELKKML
ncbi:MAG: PTS transporter subunit EIIC [Clostridiales bacterium]|nr:PTS transporter subunit EIIC [Clostridiales bacterium]